MNHRFACKYWKIGLDIAFTFSLSEVSHYYPKIVKKLEKYGVKTGHYPNLCENCNNPNGIDFESSVECNR